MKKFRILIALLTVGILLNCSKDSDDNPIDGIDKSANLLATGDSANDILSNTTYTRLVIEAAYVTGFRPTTETMDNFQTYLRNRTFKEDIQVVYRQLPSPEEETLTLQEIADLESENRTEYNDGETLAIYIYFADAPSDDDDEDEGIVTLGAVYRNTSMVIHEVTVKKLANQSALITTTDVETATLNHEFGHLFGLVDLGTAMVNNHEDPDAENHCDIDGCLMRGELEFGGGMMGLLEKSKSAKGIAVPDLDAECILDLQNNGGR
ncbi:hypothetical protein [uncultured Eudoraea sp.]|uniref:hypothetical protein n=1 Tax=uncultured Eudoraea sp. TaxID=1035614 RepID=UPI002621CB09|nr:hypothetical protein [uncultured Eudoraea sp.]